MLMRRLFYLMAVFWCMILNCCQDVHATGYFDYVDNLAVRPDVGYGYASSDGKHGMGYHAGVRILSDVRSLSTPMPVKRYGISITAVSPFESEASYRQEKYLALGIILEQALSDQFAVTIGTLGYVGAGSNKNNTFGLLAEMSWEPRLGKNVRGFAALRVETIYDTSTISRYALSAGLKYTIF